MVSGEKRDIFVGKLSLLGDEWSPLRALSTCGQILHKNPGKGQTPPPFRQCLHFGSIWSWHPSLMALSYSFLMASELFPNGSLLQQVYFGSYFHAVPLRLPSCSRVAPFCHWSILALGAIREQLQSHKRTNIRFAEDWFLEFPIPFFHHGPINTHGMP